jgi:hypothetical protein
MKLEDRDRIIEILKFQGEMIGNDSEEAIRLIKQMKQVGVSAFDQSIEGKIKEELTMLCSLINYTNDEKTNKCRIPDVISMRDAVTRVVCDKFYKYPRVGNVVANFFMKDRSTGYHMDRRTKQRVETNDPMFMFHYNNLLAEISKLAS